MEDSDEGLMTVFQAMLGQQVGPFILLELLAHGSYGAVFSGEHERTERIVAIKCLFKDGLTEEHLDFQRQEVILNRQLGSHPHVCALLDTVETPERLFLIFEFCEGGDLYEPSAKGKLTGQLGRDLFIQAIAAVEHCHSRGVFHRDLKPENLLLACGKVKLADFGLATTEPFPTDCGVGSKPYMAPEVFDKSLPSYGAAKADVWALGVIFFNMLFKVNPWEKAIPEDPHFAAHCADLTGYLRRRFSLPDPLATLFSSLFQPNPDLRLGLKELRTKILALNLAAATPSPASSPSPVSSSPQPQSNLSSLLFSSSSSSSSVPTPSASSTPKSSLSQALAAAPSASQPQTPTPSKASSLAIAIAPPRGKGTPTTMAADSYLSSSVASDASFKSAYSSFRPGTSFPAHQVQTPTSPMNINATPLSSSFSSSIASSWADDDGEMDFDAVPSFDNFDHNSSGEGTFASLNSSGGSFADDHATLHPSPLAPSPTLGSAKLASSSASSASSAATPTPTTTTTTAAATKKFSPSSFSPSSPSPSPSSRAAKGGHVVKGHRHHRPTQNGHGGQEDLSSDDEALHPAHLRGHPDADDDHGVFRFDQEDWQGSLPQTSSSSTTTLNHNPGAQATAPGGHKGSPTMAAKRSSPANTPRSVGGNGSSPHPQQIQHSRKKSGGGLSSSSFAMQSSYSPAQPHQPKSHSPSSTTPSTSSSTSGSSSSHRQQSQSTHQNQRPGHLSQSHPNQPFGSQQGHGQPQSSRTQVTRGFSAARPVAHAPSSSSSTSSSSSSSSHFNTDFDFIPAVNSQHVLSSVAHLYDSKPRAAVGVFSSH